MILSTSDSVSDESNYWEIIVTSNFYFRFNVVVFQFNYMRSNLQIFLAACVTK